MALNRILQTKNRGVKMVSKFDPINNRDNFISAIKSIYRWSRYVDQEEYTKKIGKKQDLKADTDKIDYCQTKIDEYILQWDNCQTEQERQTLVCSIERPNI